MLMASDNESRPAYPNPIHHITFRNNIFKGARANSIILGGYIDYFTFENNIVAYSGYGALNITDH
jgi:hypothetical protein